MVSWLFGFLISRFSLMVFSGVLWGFFPTFFRSLYFYGVTPKDFGGQNSGEEGFNTGFFVSGIRVLGGSHFSITGWGINASLV